MIRLFYLLLGLVSLALGAIGLFLPLLPTVPFVILAAYCFARSSRRLESWLIEHPYFGAHIAAWRDRGAISRTGKKAAILAFAISIAVGFLLLALPWSLVPALTALVGGSWILSRPTA